MQEPVQSVGVNRRGRPDGDEVVGSDGGETEVSWGELKGGEPNAASGCPSRPSGTFSLSISIIAAVGGRSSAHEEVEAVPLFSPRISLRMNLSARCASEHLRLSMQAFFGADESDSFTAAARLFAPLEVLKALSTLTESDARRFTTASAPPKPR